jgi:hypothetical protein
MIKNIMKNIGLKPVEVEEKEEVKEDVLPSELNGVKPTEKKTKTQEDYEKEYEQSLKGKNDAETLDNIVEAYDKVAKKLRPEAKAKGMNPNELNNPELEALGKLRLVYSEKNISEGEKKYREELEKLSGRMKDAINNEFGYEEES